MPKLLLWRKICSSEVVSLTGMRVTWSLNTHIMISHLKNLAFMKYSPLLQSVIFNSLLDNQPFGEVLPKIAVDPESVNDHMFKFHWPTDWIWNDKSICFNYPSNYIGWQPLWAWKKMLFQKLPEFIIWHSSSLGYEVSAQDDKERHSFHYCPTCREISLASPAEPVEFFSCLTQPRITFHTGEV